MIDLEALHEQNHKLTELSNVFAYLVRERALCDTETASRLFFDYGDRLPVHLSQVDLLVKRYLLADPDPRRVNLARKLVADSRLLRSNYDKFLTHWTDSSRRRFRIADHQAFVRETDELFELILDRIQRETEFLYPLLKKMDSAGMQAA